jgi:hypothetical protein
MLMLKSTGWLAVAAFAMLAWVGDAGATLTVLKTFTGNELVSTDGCGSNTESCTLQSNLQAGSTIQAAFLYSATFNSATDPNGITLGCLNAVNCKGAATTTPTFTPLGVTGTGVNLQAWRADITGFVLANANLGSLTTWTVTEGGKSAGLDGEAIVIVYSNAGAQPNTHTITILDGFAATIGDTATIGFTALPAGFTAHMFLGDSFSFDGFNPLAPDSISQVSTITVNGTKITTVAGHCDDSQDGPEGCAEGALLTMGGSNAGTKDDPFTPTPCDGVDCIGLDHEAYDLGRVFKVSDIGGTVITLNPSNDDNIFLQVFDLTGISEINGSGPGPGPGPGPEPGPSPVPEPGTLLLLGAGLVGLAGLRRALKRRT